jgi:uncharacterized protein
LRSPHRRTIMAAQIKVQELTGEPTEMAALQSVIEAAPTYAQRVTGYPPGSADAQSTAIALPEGKTYDDKFLYGIYLEDKLVGCADIIRGYPAPDTALIGVLLISEAHQRQGIGATAYTRIESKIKAWQGIQKIRLGVVRTDEEVLPFWQKLGFQLTGEVKPYQYGELQSETLILEKFL